MQIKESKIWLGIKIASSNSIPLNTGAELVLVTTCAYRVAAWRGLLTNITNPKALLFCSVLLPKFIHTGGLTVAVQFFSLGAILVGLGLLFDMLYVFAGAAIGQ